MADDSTPMTESPIAGQNDDIQKNWYHLLFGVRRSVRYHNRRRHFFDNLNRWKTALALLSGSAAMGAILAKMPPALPLAASVCVTMVSTLDLVVGTTVKARLHSDLARRFVDLERRMILLHSPTLDDLRESTAMRLLIEADEPPIMRVLDVLYHNELLRALGYAPDDLCYVPWYQRLLAPCISMSAEGILTIGERKRQKNT